MARTGIVFIMLIALVASAFAQSGTYRLKPDDILNIAIYGEAQVQQQVTVGPDGNISAPFVGIVRAEGRTTSELEAELVELYKKKLDIKDPRVSVTIFRFRSVRATILGAVNAPGLYELRPGDTILALVGMGRSAVLDRAITRRCTLRRAKSNEVIPVDLNAIMNGDTSQNYEIEDGDVFTVPDDTNSGYMNQVSVQGAVAAPGYFPYREGMRVYDALSLARGEVPGRSKLSEVYVIRPAPGQPGRYFRIKTNIVKFIRQGVGSENIQLMPGDTVFASFNRTPDFNQMGAAFNSFFVIDRFFRDGLFGFRLFRF